MAKRQWSRVHRGPNNNKQSRLTFYEYPVNVGLPMPVSAEDPGVMSQARQIIAGSTRTSVGATLGTIGDDTLVEATILLRRPLERPAPEEGALSTDDFAARCGADPAHAAAVTEALESAGIRVLDRHLPSGRLRVAGGAATVSAFFGTTLEAVDPSSGHTRARSGPLSVPEPLGDVVVGVLGLDDRPQAAVRSTFRATSQQGVSYTPLELAAVYGMPQADGSGQTAAIIELGGGFGKSDLDTYFSSLGLATPHVKAIGVDGATNVPGKDPQGADGEVLLDIEVLGAIAPKAKIDVYFAPNTDAGFVDAIATATHATPTPCSMSISWGQSEDQWTGQALTAMDTAIADAVAMGITVTVAAGDNGSGDNQKPGAHADFPASSPHALACGGTSLQASGGMVTSEVVWNDGGHRGATGGGVSDVFPLPPWQASVGVPEKHKKSGRGVPDVAANADPQTGYEVLVDGQQAVIGGTSAVAPLWAGLIARLVQLQGKPIGLAQARLYAAATAGHTPAGLRDITSGRNGAYKAGSGWDACTGLGVPAAGVLAS